MISIQEARTLILQQARKNPATPRPLLESVGLVLAEDVASDIDSPPHDKSLVDGFAVRSAGVTSHCELEVVQRVTAGELPIETVRPGTAVQIMTGAPLPTGADAVVMVEQTSESSRPEAVRIEVENVVSGQNIMRQGAAIERGSIVLTAGHVVRPFDVGLLAEVGCCDVPVIEPPRVAVLATGNELVDARQSPQAGMIRNSNGPMLCALAQSAHAQVRDLKVASDNVDSLRQTIQQGLDHDALVLSGGVSAGVLDLVPQVLEQLGVERVFHKVRLKPGKPMWFGVHRGRNRSCFVFGLPGNPVGSLVCFELFVAPVLRTLAGRDAAVIDSSQACLAVPHDHRSDRPTYHPARAERGGKDALEVTPIPWRGSSDQRALALANCLMLLPAGARKFVAGEAVPVVMLPGIPSERRSREGDSL